MFARRKKGLFWYMVQIIGLVSLNLFIRYKAE
jgi:hypothetical protein